MTPEQIEEIIDKARRTHTGELQFADWVVWLRNELKQLSEKEAQS
jgi:hypothetical protein